MFAPAPTGELDPRPLAEAILGTWQTGPISMVFMPDGTMVATLPGGQQRRGHWSIGSDGKLHSDATGRDQASDDEPPPARLVLEREELGVEVALLRDPVGLLDTQHCPACGA